MDTPKSREELIAQCKYYDGTEESSCQMFGDYEQIWVEKNFSEEGRDLLQRNVNAYKAFGLEHFNEEDGVPMSLKALLWSRFMYWGCGRETPEDFAKWWKDTYLKKV